MKIFISSIIFNIPFMFPDPEDLRKELGEKICIAINNSDKFIKKYNKANLAFIIVLDRKTKELHIIGPTVDSELVDYAIWFPYQKIRNSKNYRLAYLNYLKEGIIRVLTKYDFDVKLIEEIFLELENKELNKNI